MTSKTEQAKVELPVEVVREKLQRFLSLHQDLEMRRMVENILRGLVCVGTVTPEGLYVAMQFARLRLGRDAGLAHKRKYLSVILNSLESVNPPESVEFVRQVRKLGY